MSARLILLIVSLILLAASLVLSMTPLAWTMSGRQAESYLELFFFIFCLPPAALLVVDALLMLWLKRNRDCRLIWLSAALKLLGFASFPLVLAVVLTHLQGLRSIEPAITWLFRHFHWVVTAPALALTLIGLAVAALDRAKDRV